MCHTTSWVVTGSQTMQDTHPAVARRRSAPAEAATPDEARGGVAEQRAGATLSGSESAVGPDVRRDVLVEVITSKLREDYWVESQSETETETETEARLVVLGRKRRFGVFGGRAPEAREIVRVDERGRTRIELLPARRY
jgi:hypothetical protein